MSINHLEHYKQYLAGVTHHVTSRNATPEQVHVTSGQQSCRTKSLEVREGDTVQDPAEIQVKSGQNGMRPSSGNLQSGGLNGLCLSNRSDMNPKRGFCSPKLESLDANPEMDTNQT